MTLASKQVARGARYRHVVFKGSGRRRAVDLAPRTFAHTPPLLYRCPPPLDAADQRFVDWLFERGGLDARAYRPETLRRRLPACLRALRAGSLAEARLTLEAKPASMVDAINSMVIGVTSFFRDASVFDHLTERVLPVLPRTQGHARVWSAGCSDGAELYSIAMLLAERNLLGGSYLLGTDCRPHALAAARVARYEQRLLRDVPPPWREKYFELARPAASLNSAGAEACVRPALRAAVQWRSGDVTRMCEPGAWDVILCRNLAMYLRPEVAGSLWHALENALRPGGFLVLGKAERPTGARRLELVAPCVYRRSRA